MNTVLLREAPYLNIRSKLKGRYKNIIFGSDTSLVSTLFEKSFLPTGSVKMFRYVSPVSVVLYARLFCD